ncbi:ABC transporter permease [Parabacteroides sp.]
MKQLFYTISYLKNAWGNNLIKVFTLTLGLAIGLILFARISFDLSYDKFLPDAENIYQVQMIYTTGVGTETSHSTEQCYSFQPIAPTMPLEIPGVVAGTSTTGNGERVIFEGENRYTVKAILADTMFFKTLPFKILSGDDMGLKTGGNVFLSESLSRRIFKGEDPIGKVLFNDKKQKSALTVVGTFEDVPENSHLDFDIIYSIANNSRNSWNGGDGYVGYVRLQANADLKEINEKAIPAMLERHMDREAMAKKGYSFDSYLKPVTTLHTDNKETKLTLLVLSILATLILVSVSLNYVMMSISSLATRARTMAIYKSNGASSGNIFMMNLSETVILILISLVCTALLILAGGNWITELTGITLGSLFAGRQLLVSLGLVLLVVLLSGVVPARIFSAIPVTQAFRFYNYSKRGWKQGLLGIQIACAAFMLMFLGIVLMQYNRILDKDMGYEPDNLVFCQLDSIPAVRQEMVRMELLRSPEIENITFTAQLVCGFFSGTPLIDPETQEALTTLRFEFADSCYVNTIGLNIAQGGNIPTSLGGDPLPALVNRRFLELLHWEEDPIGRTYTCKGLFDVVISGVLDDFIVGSIFTPQTPIVIVGIDGGWNSFYMNIRLQQMSPESFTRLENRLRELLPDQDIVLTTYRDKLHESYRDTERFRNSVVVAAVFMLLITLMGLVGYVSDEIRRRSKEIAIRKVNGATATDVLKLLLRNIIIIGLPAVMIGLAGTYLAGDKWLENFPEKISLNVFIFVLGGLALLAMIGFCVVLRSWYVANENPVKSIKSE